jgi:hypothetical protein
VSTQPVRTGSLFTSLDRLTRGERQRLARKPLVGQPLVEYVDVPSLWTQMEEAVGSTNSSDGAPSKSTGSRAPLDVAITALMHDIATRTKEALIGSGIAPRYLDEPRPAARPRPTVELTRHPAPASTGGLGLPVIDPDHAAKLLEQTQRRIADLVDRASSGRRQRDTPSDLRALALHLAAGTTPQDVIDEWETTYRSWVVQAETALALIVEDAVTTHPVRGQACPYCAATTVTRLDDDGRYLSPAVVASIRDGRLLDITCRSCGSDWLPGEGRLEDFGAPLPADARGLSA